MTRKGKMKNKPKVDKEEQSFGKETLPERLDRIEQALTFILTGLAGVAEAVEGLLLRERDDDVV